MSGVTLADLIPKSMEVGFKEEDHMQPVLIDLIQAAMDAVQCDCYLIDTHSSNQLDDPISRPDCTLIAAGHMAMWTQGFLSGSSKSAVARQKQKQCLVSRLSAAGTCYTLMINANLQWQSISP